MDRRLALLITLALLVAACTPGNSGAPLGGASGDESPPAVMASEVAAEVAVGASAEAAPPQPATDWAVDVSATLQGEGTQVVLGQAFVDPDGGWTLPGLTELPDGTARPTIWTSIDAQDWARRDLPDQSGGLIGGATSGDAAVMVGNVGVDRAAVPIIFRREKGGDWAPVDLGDLADPPGLTLTDVAAGPGGFAALATVWAEGQRPIYVSLWSRDGREWQRGAAFEFDGETVNGRVERIVATTAAWIAVGSRFVEGGRTGLTWMSDDGLQWRTTGVISAEGPVTLNAVAVSQTGQIVVGGGELLTGGWQPRAWVSDDGSNWVKAPGELPVPRRRPSNTSDGLVEAIAATPDGWIATGGNRPSKRVWRSADAMNWTEVTLPEGLAGTSTPALARLAVRGAQVLVGGVSPPPLLLRIEGDAIFEVTADSAAFPGPYDPIITNEVIATTIGTLITGSVVHHSVAIGDPTVEGLLWLRTQQGLQSQSNPDVFRDARVMGITPWQGGYLAAGNDAYVPRVFNQRSLSPAVWTSPDGRHWQRSNTTGLASRPGLSQWVIRAAAIADRAALGGYTDTSQSGKTAQIWTSSDGIDWQPAELPGLDPTASSRITDFCTLPTGLVAVGRQAGAAAAWTTADGLTWTAVPPATIADDPWGEFRLCEIAGDQAIVLGYRGGRPGLARSSDGQTWETISDPVFDSALDLPSLATQGQTVVIVGVNDDGATGQLSLWRSDDAGDTWRVMPLDGPAFADPRSVSAYTTKIIDDEVILLGTSGPRNAVWTAPLDSPEAGAP